MQVLRAVHQAAGEGAFPGSPPREILGLLNDVGPHLDERALPVVEGVLDAMWREGLIGAVPPPTPRDATRYMTRGAAVRAISWGAPVIVHPLASRPSAGVAASRPPFPTVGPTPPWEENGEEHRG